MSKLIGIGLDAVCQRIHTRIRRYLCRHRPCQFGVDIGRISDKKWRHDTLLQMVTLIEQDGIWRHLAARACRGGQTGEPESLCLDESRTEAVLHLLVAVDERRHEFRHVEHASAADTHHTVSPKRTSHTEYLSEVRNSRLCLDIAVYGPTNARLCQLHHSVLNKWHDGGRSHYE